MTFKLDHTNLNVLDLDKSLAFYQRALGLKEQRRKESQDGSFTLVFLSDEAGLYSLELTCLHGRKEPYNLGDNETHIAFTASDMDAAHALHKEMGCICYENPGMGIYFIEDPDGYWLEIIPAR